jgi:hypothetical protein
MTIKSIEEYEKRYLPITFEAHRISHLSKEEYREWYFKTLEPYRTQVINELVEIGKAHYAEYRRISDLVE